MSCCGHKRAQLLQPQSRPRRQDVSVSVDRRTKPNHAPRLLEYIGSDSFVLRGAVSGMTYCFAHRGDCIEVRYEDSFAMLAEQEIRLKT